MLNSVKIENCITPTVKSVFIVGTFQIHQCVTMLCNTSLAYHLGKHGNVTYTQMNGGKFNWKNITSQSLRNKKNFSIFKEAINLGDTGNYSCVTKSNPVQILIWFIQLYLYKLNCPCILDSKKT